MAEENMNKLTKIVGDMAVINSDTPIIVDAQSALDLVTTMVFDHDVTKIVINKAAIIGDFFVLSTGLAGEIVQKFVNYRVRIAIHGDFSCYTSKPLHDFIFECNKGKYLNFARDEEDAMRRLSQ